MIKMSILIRDVVYDAIFHKYMLIFLIIFFNKIYFALTFINKLSISQFFSLE